MIDGCRTCGQIAANAGGTWTVTVQWDDERAGGGFHHGTREIHNDGVIGTVVLVFGAVACQCREIGALDQRLRARVGCLRIG